MNYKKISFKLPLLVVLVMGLIALSCKKSLTGFVEDASTARSFTPGNLRISTVRDSVKFTWTPGVYAAPSDRYTLELSTDSLFAKVDFSKVTDTTAALVMDTDIRLNVLYFARVRVNANTAKGTAPSNYAYNLKAFRLNGQQYFKVLRDFEITTTSVFVHWYVNPQTAGLTQMRIIRPDINDTATVAISPSEVTGGQKTISTLAPKTRYTLQLLAGAKSKGLLTFTTPEVVTITTTLSPTDNLATAIANAANGDVLGLNPGTYNLASITYITQKKITIRSISNNPADTKILSREINLVGDSAGVTLVGLEFNGNYTGTTYGVHFLQLLGNQTTTNQAAAFSNIRIDNCIIHDYTRAIIRANYGAAANTQSINNIAINNSRIYNVDQTSAQGYYMFSFEKLQLKSFALTKSTLNQIGNGLINMSTALSTTSGIVPDIRVDYCTFNAFGGGASKYLLIDANANKVVFAWTNSIVANSPISGSLQAAAFRASNTANDLSYSNNNTFKLLSAPGGSVVNLTGLQMANPYDLDLGWTAATVNFNLATLPVEHTVLFASQNGSTVGDPRWAY
ncbi:MAG: DUF4957 domain-containing protein [Bacteroidota bacterium]